jgi:16S rRNA (cytosine967-C5)-methyltransferase
MGFDVAMTDTSSDNPAPAMMQPSIPSFEPAPQHAKVAAVRLSLRCLLVGALWCLTSSVSAFSRGPLLRRPVTFLSLSSDEAAIATSGPSSIQNVQEASARQVAAEAILERKGGVAFAIDKLESHRSFGSLSTRDRSFARLLVTTSIRRLGQVDKVLDSCQNDKKNANTNTSSSKKTRRKRTNKVDLYIQAVLRIGAVQLLFLQTPAHAAVKESVDVLRLPKDFHVPEAKVKYVNAVLRRLGREGSQLLAQTSVRDNASEWLVKELTEAWGPEATSSIIESAMNEAPRCLTVKQAPGSSSAEKQVKVEKVAGLFEESTILSQDSVLVLSPPPGMVSDWPLYHEGEWWLQDVSATLPALALHNTLTKEGTIDHMHVVDLCAAPGGKTAQLCCGGFGRVTAVEVSKRRCARLEENLERLQLSSNCQVVVADGTEWVPEDGRVDGVLIDAPCTATGTGSKRPDVLRKNPEFTDLLETQYRLLCHVVDNVLKPGGVLVYATCSLLKQESEDQVHKFVAREKDGCQVETLPFAADELPGFENCIDTNGWLRVIPGRQDNSIPHVDGFFVARLKKTL